VPVVFEDSRFIVNDNGSGELIIVNKHQEGWHSARVSICPYTQKLMVSGKRIEVVSDNSGLPHVSVE